MRRDQRGRRPRCRGRGRSVCGQRRAVWHPRGRASTPVSGRASRGRRVRGARRMRQRAGGVGTRENGRDRREADEGRDVRRARLRHRAARRAAADLRRRAGRHDPRRARRAGAAARRSSTSRSRVVAGGEQGLLSMAFAPDYAKTRRFYVNYTDRARRAARRRVPPLEVQRRARRRRQRAARAALRRQSSPTTTAGSSRSAPTGCCTSAPATAAAPTTSTARAATPRTSAGCSASSCASTRAAPAAAPYRRAVEQPVRRPLRRAAGDLQLRPAQPVALLVRPHDRRPDDRRRRPGRDRGDRLRAQGRRRAARTTAGGRSRARRRNFDEPAPGAVAPVLELTHDRRQLLGHRRLRRARPALPALAGPLRLRRLLQGPAALGAAVARARRAATARSACKTVDQLSSFGEDARGRVYVVSLDGPVYRLAAGG